MVTKPGARSARPTVGGRSLLLLAVAVLAVSSSAVLVRYADLSPVALAFWRTAGGAAVLAVPSMVSGRQPRRPQWPLLALAGIALGAHFATWLASLEMTSVTASVTLVTTAPLIIAVALVVLGRRPSGRTWLAIGLAIAGTLVIAGGDLGSGSDSATALAGDGLAVLGAMAMAIYLTAGTRLRATLPTTTYAAWTYAGAALVLVVVALVWKVDLWPHGTTTWLAIGAMIVGPQLAGHTALNLLLRDLGSVTVSVALLAEPLVASLLIWLLFAELPPAAAVLGAPLVVTGLVLQITAGATDRSAPDARSLSMDPTGQ